MYLPIIRACYTSINNVVPLILRLVVQVVVTYPREIGLDEMETRLDFLYISHALKYFGNYF